MSKVLITGAAGFIGSCLAERLVHAGHEAVGVDCFTDYYPRALKELNAEDVRAKGVKILELDLAADDLNAAVEGAEVVYHLAAQPGISSKVPFGTYLRNNIVAAHRLLEATKQLPSLRLFVNISTSSVYGYYATDSEEAEPKPASYYGVTKLAAEQLVMSYYREHNMPACSLRVFSAYGERERPEKLFPRLIRSILEDKEFYLYEGSEKHFRAFTYVGDVVDGFVSVLGNLDRCIGEIINIGSDKEVRTIDAISIVEEALGAKANIVVGPRRIGDQLKTSAKIDKARELLDYEPKSNLEDGIKAEIDWFKTKVIGGEFESNSKV